MDAQAAQGCRARCEALCQITPQAANHRQLEGDIAREGAVGSLGQPYVGHASGTEFALQAIGANTIVGRKRRYMRRIDASRQKRELHQYIVGFATRMRCEQLGDRWGQGGLRNAQLVEPNRARSRLQVERLVEQLRHGVPGSSRDIHGRFALHVRKQRPDRSPSCRCGRLIGKRALSRGDADSRTHANARWPVLCQFRTSNKPGWKTDARILYVKKLCIAFLYGCIRRRSKSVTLLASSALSRVIPHFDCDLHVGRQTSACPNTAPENT